MGREQERPNKVVDVIWTGYFDTEPTRLKWKGILLVDTSWKVMRPLVVPMNLTNTVFCLNWISQQRSCSWAKSHKHGQTIGQGWTVFAPLSNLSAGSRQTDSGCDGLRYPVPSVISTLQKTTATRHIVVRETSVSRHHEVPIEGSLEISRILQHYRIEGFKGVLNLAPIMPRAARFSTSGCIFSSLLIPWEMRRMVNSEPFIRSCSILYKVTIYSLSSLMSS